MPRVAKAAGDKPAPKRKKAGAYKMPDPLPAGEVLTDIRKKQWSLGASVGKGGFGEIYLALEVKDGRTQGEPSHVIKIEPHENGPLFCELHFYQRAGKADIISAWKKKQKLKHLGVPKYVASGHHDFKGKKYRFLVMERFGEDLWNIFLRSGRRFTPKVAFSVGIQLVDALEYLHAQGYVHADIKGSNILLGFGPSAKDQVFLVDFGLASKYMPGNVHRECKPDPKKAHDGTLEYTSIGAHEGIAPARKHDFEILGYNLVQWMSGSLPWTHLTNEVEVQSCKVKNSKNRASFLQMIFKDKYPKELNDYFNYVDKLQYEAEPDYNKIKDLFKKGITSAGGKFDGKLELALQSKNTAKVSKAQSPRKRPKKSSSDIEDEEIPVKRKRKAGSKDTVKEMKTPEGKSPRKSPAKGSDVKPMRNAKKRQSDSTEGEDTPAKKRTKATKGRRESSLEAESTCLPKAAPEGEKKRSVKSPGRRGSGNMKNTEKKLASGKSESKVMKTNQRKPRDQLGSKRVKRRMVDSVSIATQTSPGLKGLKRTQKRTQKKTIK